MSDRCTTNKALEDLLEAEKGGPVNRFKCGIHPLDTIARDCDKHVREYETDISFTEKRPKGNYPFIHRTESHTQALIRTAGKIFHDTAYSCSHEFACFLSNKPGATDHNLAADRVVYHRYVGNRFHVMFLNSGILYHLIPDMVDFFNNVFNPANVVQSAVVNAVQCNDMHITLRAFGLIGKFITGPWMRLVGKVQHILELNPHFAEAREKLQSWSKDARPLLSAEATSIFTVAPILADPVFRSLTASKATDAATCELVKKLCSVILSVVERQLETQLPGGAFWEPSQELCQAAQSCSSTNISGERVFAVCDREMARAPGAQHGFIEAKVLFKSNKTAGWLMEKTEAEREQTIRTAMKEAREIRKEEKAEQRKLKEKISEMLQAKRKEQLEKEDKERKKLEETLEEMYDNGGLWEETQVQDQTAPCPEKSNQCEVQDPEIRDTEQNPVHECFCGFPGGTSS